MSSRAQRPYEVRGGVLTLSGRKGDAELGAAIRDRPWENVTTLDLSASKVSDKAMVDLAQALERDIKRSAIVSIDVSDCQRIGRDTVTAIAAIIERVRSFQSVSFRGCGRIEDDSMQMLALVLKSSRSPTSLDLSRCFSLSDDAVVEIAKAITRNTRLATLRLAMCFRLTDRSLEQLAVALRKNKALQTLDVSSCSLLSDRGAVEVARALHSNSALTRLDVSGCYAIGDTAVSVLADALHANSTLRELGMRGLYNIADDGLRVLEEAALARSAPLTLELSGVDQLTPERLGRLRSALEARGGSLLVEMPSPLDLSEFSTDDGSATGSSGYGVVPLPSSYASPAPYAGAGAGAGAGGPPQPGLGSVLGGLLLAPAGLMRSLLELVTPRSVREERAAVWIQSAVRGFLARKQARFEAQDERRLRIDESREDAAARTISKQWRSHRELVAERSGDGGNARRAQRANSWHLFPAARRREGGKGRSKVAKGKPATHAAAAPHADAQRAHTERLRRLEAVALSGDHAQLVADTKGVLAKLAMLSNVPIGRWAMEIWQDRFVSAQPMGLMYRKVGFNEKPYGEPRPIPYVTIDYVHRLDGAAFFIKTTERGYVFGTESEEEAERWVHAIATLSFCERRAHQPFASTQALLAKERRRQAAAASGRRSRASNDAASDGGSPNRLSRAPTR